MAIIYTYPRKSTAEANDLVVISDSSDSNKTKQLTLQSIADYIDGEVTLQEVLDTGNTATDQSITLTGLGGGGSNITIDGDFRAFNITALNNTTVDGNLTVNGTSSTLNTTLTVSGSTVINNRVSITGTELALDTGTELRVTGGAGVAGYTLQSNGAGVRPSWVNPSSVPAGNLQYEVELVDNVSIGDPLYIESNVAGVIKAGKADASDATKMPAAGLADQIGIIGDTINMVEIGALEGDIIGPGTSVGDILYVAIGGGLTDARPVATNVSERNNLFIQNVGIVSRNDGTNDRIQVTCIGRSNALPQTSGLYGLWTSDLYGNPEQTASILTVVTDSSNTYANSVLTLGSNNVTYIDSSGVAQNTGNTSQTFLNGYVKTDIRGWDSADKTIAIVGGPGPGAPMPTYAGNRNVIIGYEAGAATTSAEDNVVIGERALSSDSVSDFSVIIGAEAGSSSTASSQTIAIGQKALSRPTNISSNIAIGTQVMEGDAVSPAIGDRNIAIGNFALQDVNDTGIEDNIAIGINAMGDSRNSQTQYNVAIGSNASRGLINERYNVAIGHRAGEQSNGALGQIIIGGYLDSGSPASRYGGDGSVLIGYRVAENVPSTLNVRGNIIIGELAGTGIDGLSASPAPASEFNVIIGDQACNTHDDINNCVIIGTTADVAGSTVNNAIAIGDRAITGRGSVSVGQGTTTATNGVAVGLSATTSGTNAVAVGQGTTAVANSVAIGVGASNGTDSVAIGDSASSGNDGVAVGQNASGGIGGIALGKAASSAGGLAINLTGAAMINTPGPAEISLEGVTTGPAGPVVTYLQVYVNGIEYYIPLHEVP